MSNFKILKKQFTGETVAQLVRAWMGLCAIAQKKLGERSDKYGCVNEYIDAVLRDGDYRGRLERDGDKEELAALKEAEQIMDLGWWRYYRDFYHIFSCGVEMGYASGKKNRFRMPSDI